MEWQDGPPTKPGLFLLCTNGKLRTARIVQVGPNTTSWVGGSINGPLIALWVDLPEQLATSAVWRAEQHLAIPEPRGSA